MLKKRGNLYWQYPPIVRVHLIILSKNQRKKNGVYDNYYQTIMKTLTNLRSISSKTNKFISINNLIHLINKRSIEGLPGIFITDRQLVARAGGRPGGIEREGGYRPWWTIRGRRRRRRRGWPCPRYVHTTGYTAVSRSATAPSTSPGRGSPRPAGLGTLVPYSTLKPPHLRPEKGRWAAGGVSPAARACRAPPSKRLSGRCTGLHSTAESLFEMGHVVTCGACAILFMLPHPQIGV